MSELNKGDIISWGSTLGEVRFVKDGKVGIQWDYANNLRVIHPYEAFFANQNFSKVDDLPDDHYLNKAIDHANDV